MKAPMMLGSTVTNQIKGKKKAERGKKKK